MSNSILTKSEEYVRDLLSSNTPPGNAYHNIEHTKQVVDECITIGTASNINDGEMEIVAIAGWFHDVGYIQKVQEHELVSIAYAEQFLNQAGYPKTDIEMIKNCILATKMPQTPENLLAEILCDADLSHLGKATFEMRNNLYRHEFEYHNGNSLTDFDWLVRTIEFVTAHHFFTEYAKKNFSDQEEKNLLRLHKQLNKIRNKITR